MLNDVKIDNFVMKPDEIRFKEFQEVFVDVLCKLQIARWLAVDEWPISCMELVLM